jgi:hypothetical protein
MITYSFIKQYNQVELWQFNKLKITQNYNCSILLTYELLAAQYYLIQYGKQDCKWAMSNSYVNYLMFY